MLEVLRAARQISEWSGGKFDVTFGALADVWKFDHDQDNTVPTREQIQARLPLVDYSAVEVDQAAGTVFLKRKGMRIHLGGIGKGYAVDHAVKILRDRGFHHFMIQAGGDLYVGGLQHGKPWRLGIADPRNPDAELRRARSVGRHVQHVRRLRAFLLQGRDAATTTSSTRTSANRRGAAAA